MISKLFNDKLYQSPKKWVDTLEATFKRSRLIFWAIFVIINVVIAVFTFATSLIAILVNSKLIEFPAASATSQSPSLDYPTLVVIVNAVSGFLLALINFLVVRPRYQAAAKNWRYIQSEKILFEIKTNEYATAKQPEALLAANVAKYMGYGIGEYK